MRAFFGNYAIVFFVGLLVMAAALGFGSVGGEMLSTHPALTALRSLGGGLMLAGLAMWIALLRDEAGQPGLSPLFALLVIIGSVMLLVNVFDPFGGMGAALGWGGLGLTGVALVLGLLSMLIAPAYPQKPTARWPEGGEQEASHPGTEHH